MAKKITRPSDTEIKTGKGSVRLSFSSSFPARMDQLLSKKQEIVDSEVLRLCAPLVPKRTGTLERSGTMGTVIGSGEVKYVAPYAKAQYYNTAQSRSYDPRRGGMWFERMKTAHKKEIERLLEG